VSRVSNATPVVETAHRDIKRSSDATPLGAHPYAIARREVKQDSEAAPAVTIVDVSAHAPHTLHEVHALHEPTVARCEVSSVSEVKPVTGVLIDRENEAGAAMRGCKGGGGGGGEGAVLIRRPEYLQVERMLRLDPSMVKEEFVISQEKELDNELIALGALTPVQLQQLLCYRQVTKCVYTYVSKCIYTYICIHVCVYVYIYMYI